MQKKTSQQWFLDKVLWGKAKYFEEKQSTLKKSKVLWRNRDEQYYRVFQLYFLK